jgi:hypothetical protein
MDAARLGGRATLGVQLEQGEVGEQLHGGREHDQLSVEL